MNELVTFLASASVISLSGVLAPGALTAATIAAGARRRWAGTMVAVGHGIVELPAAIIGTAFALRIGAALVSPPKGLDVGQGFLLVLANFCKIFLFLVVPLLLSAAFIEANLTPHIVLALYGAR